MANLWERWKYDQPFRRVLSEAWEGLSAADRTEILQNRDMGEYYADLPLPSVAAEYRRYSPQIMDWFFKDIGKKAQMIEAQMEGEITEVEDAGTIMDEGAFKGTRCDFCGRPAEYDGRTSDGPWANMCEDDFQLHGVGLGTGKGQRLRSKTPKEKAKPATKIKGVTMSEDDLETSVLEGVWYPTCPYCGAETPAEPDARAVYCQSCDQKFLLNNPYY